MIFAISANPQIPGSTRNFDVKQIVLEMGDTAFTVATTNGMLYSLVDGQTPINQSPNGIFYPLVSAGETLINLENVTAGEVGIVLSKPAEEVTFLDMFLVVLQQGIAMQDAGGTFNRLPGEQVPIT